jgi:hypothetical protein
MVVLFPECNDIICEPVLLEGIHVGLGDYGRRQYVKNMRSRARRTSDIVIWSRQYMY